MSERNYWYYIKSSQAASRGFGRGKLGTAPNYSQPYCSTFRTVCSLMEVTLNQTIAVIRGYNTVTSVLSKEVGLLLSFLRKSPLTSSADDHTGSTLLMPYIHSTENRCICVLWSLLSHIHTHKSCTNDSLLQFNYSCKFSVFVVCSECAWLFHLAASLGLLAYKVTK